MTQSEIKDLLQPILWDYDLEAYEFYRIARGERQGIGFLNQERAIVRILERLGWYEILGLLGLDFIKEHLTPELIAKLRFPEQKRKYEIIRKILHREPLSFPGWSAETRARARNTVLSDRWYCTEPALF
jgi:hypothetical protein